MHGLLRVTLVFKIESARRCMAGWQRAYSSATNVRSSSFSIAMINTGSICFPLLAFFLMVPQERQPVQSVFSPLHPYKRSAAVFL